MQPAMVGNDDNDDPDFDADDQLSQQKKQDDDDDEDIENSLRQIEAAGSQFKQAAAPMDKDNVSDKPSDVRIDLSKVDEQNKKPVVKLDLNQPATFEEEKVQDKDDYDIDPEALKQVMDAERNQALNDEELARQLQNEFNNDDSEEDEEE